MKTTRAIPDAETVFEASERPGKKYWPETTPLLGATPTLPEEQVIGLVKAVRRALEADARASEV